MKCCIKVLTVILSFLISSNLLAADITTMKRYGAEDVANHISTKVLEANKLVISTGYYSVQNPDTFVIEGTSDNIVYDRVDNWGTLIGYGLFDVVELDLGINFSYELLDTAEKEDLIDRTDEKSGNNLSAKVPNAFDFASFSGMLKIRVLDVSFLKVSIAGLFESKSRDTAIYTVSRSSKFAGGWAFLSELTPVSYLSLSFNAGSMYSSQEQLGDYKIGDRVFIHSLVTVSPTENLDIFGGVEFKNIKMNSSYAMGNNAYGGVKVKGSNLSLTVFAGSKLDDGGVGFGKLFLGSSLAYFVNFSDNSNTNEVKEVRKAKKIQTASEKNAKRLDSKKQLPNKEYSLTQKDGVYYDYDGNPIDVANNFKEIKDNEKDEFYDFDQRIEASVRNDELDPEILSEKYYEEELNKARIERANREKAELAEYQKAEKARKQALKQRVDEEDRLDEEYARNEFKELKDLPEIQEDEINWNGLK